MRRERFRQLLSGSDCVYPASIFDPVSARIAQDLGFELSMMAGSIASFSILDVPDLIILTLSEPRGSGASREPGERASAPDRRGSWLWQCNQRDPNRGNCLKNTG
jgi:hypothetical protein